MSSKTFGIEKPPQDLKLTGVRAVLYSAVSNSDRKKYT